MAADVSDVKGICFSFAHVSSGFGVQRRQDLVEI